MEIQEQRDLATRLRLWLPELRPRPNSGRLWLDILFLLLVAVVQLSLLPSIFGSYLVVDLLTPWLAISFVRQRAPQATVLLIVAALALESHSSAPSGIYLCSYWIMANVIMHVRPTLSWRHQVPWIATFAASQVWIVIFESFVIMFLRGLGELGPLYWLLQIVRVGISTAFGMLLCRQWLEFDAEEPVPP